MSSAKTKATRIEQAIIEATRDPILQKMLEQERIESSEVDTSLIFRLLGYLRPHTAFSLLCLALISVEALLMTLPAFVVGLAVDTVRNQGQLRTAAQGLGGIFTTITQHLTAAISSIAPDAQASTAQVIAFGALILIIWTCRWLVAVLATYSVQKLGQRIVHDLRLDIYRHITSMDMGYFHKNPVGRLVNRTTFDTQSISQFFSDAFSQGLLDILFISFLIIMMLSLDAPLALILIGALPLLVASGFIYRKLARPAMRTNSAVLSRINSWLAENINGMRENQLYGVVNRRRGEFGALTDAHQTSIHKLIQAWAMLRPMMMLICAFATAIVLWQGYERVLTGAVTVGVLLTFLQYTNRLWIPVRNLAEKLNVIQTALTAAERIFDVLGVKTKMYNSPDAKPDLTVEHGQIQFKDVRFSYPNKAEDEVLKGINFEVKPGQMLALVGDTGAGKSTIIHLLSRFYDASQGEVLIDEQPIKSYYLEQLRRGIALVPQDVVIFAGTIRENITLGLEVDDERIWECAKAVCADRFINKFPDKLDHVMDEAGRTLSAGERQLLSFARALVYNPPILILDEATANVDTETENLIQQALEQLTEGRTSVVIAHRLSTISDADQILVLRHGQIIEQGTHGELLDKKGEYSRLHKLHMSAQT